MKILSIDIGAGTEDILLYDDEKNIENCIKMILPSPSLLFASKVEEATEAGKNLHISGDVIGGGRFTVAIKNHLKKGLRVIMTEKSAYTIRNDLDEVRKFGIEITQDTSAPKDFRGEILEIREVDINELQSFLSKFNENLSEVNGVAIAVQDHGVAPKGTSNRKFRLQKMKELLNEENNPEQLAFTEKDIPPFFIRMKSAAAASRRQLPNAKVVLMDTAPAAIIGSLNDPKVETADPILAVNAGNSHTMAALIAKGKILGIFEHHTEMLDSNKIKKLLIKFADGTLTDEEVFNDGGHGLFYLKDPPRFSKIKLISATGPKRSILKNIDPRVHFAAPAGDMMMTGPIGLVKVSKSKIA
jgi:uncharacterized protein (DUF1786 family)